MHNRSESIPLEVKLRCQNLESGPGSDSLAAHPNPRGRGGMVVELGEDRRSAGAAGDGRSLTGPRLRPDPAGEGQRPAS